MSSDADVAIRLRGVGKTFAIYERPHHRLMATLLPRWRAWHRDFHALSHVDLDVRRGETLGIVGGAWIGTRLGMAVLPVEVRWRDLAGVAALGGIGFTVSIFISNLAFADEALVNDAKLGIIAASVLASIVGALILRGHRRSAEPNFLR